jgi:hypothetical protein
LSLCHGARVFYAEDNQVKLGTPRVKVSMRILGRKAVTVEPAVSKCPPPLNIGDQVFYT